MKCQVCGTENLNDSVACVKCGTELKNKIIIDTNSISEEDIIKDEDFEMIDTDDIPSQLTQNTYVQQSTLNQNINQVQSIQPVQNANIIDQTKTEQTNIQEQHNNEIKNIVQEQHNNEIKNTVQEQHDNEIKNIVQEQHDNEIKNIVQEQHDNEIKNTVQEQPVKEQALDDDKQSTMPNNIISPIQSINDIKMQNVEKVQEIKKYPDKKKTKILKPAIIIILIIVIVITILLLSKISVNKVVSYNKSNSYNPKAPILVQKKENGSILYGYISNETGNLVIPYKYIDASKFNNKYAIVSEKKQEDDKEKIIKEIIDENGKVVMTYENATFFSKYNIWLIDGILYNNYLKQLSKDGIKVETKNKEEYFRGYFSWEDGNNKSGIMDVTGKITYSYNMEDNFKNISLTVSNTGQKTSEIYCIINLYSSTNSKYAIVNCKTGEMVYEYTQYPILDKGLNTFEVTESSTKTNSIIYVENNKIKYNVKKINDQSYIKYDNNGYLIISNGLDNTKIYYDLKTKKEVTTRDDITKIIEEGTNKTKYNEYDIVKCSDGIGIFKDKKEIIKCDDKSISTIDDNIYRYMSINGKDYVLVTKQEKTELFNLKNKKIDATFNTNNVYTSEGSEFLFYIDKDTKKCVIYSLITNKRKAFNDYNKIGTNYVIIEEDNKYNYYNNNFINIYQENKE